MIIEIDNVGFSFGNRRLKYDLYYYNDFDRFNAPTPAEKFKKILLIWAEVLKASDSSMVSTYLPYAPKDQGTYCLKATQTGDCRVVVEMAEVRADGWAMKLDEVEIYMTAPMESYKQENEAIGEFDKSELIDALENAHVLVDGDT